MFFANWAALSLQLLITGCVSLAGACNIAALSHCINLQSSDLYERFQNESLFPVYDNATLDLICGHVESANSSQCAISARSHCRNDYEAILFNSTVDVLNFVCSSLSGYKEHRDCYKKEHVIRRGGECNVEYTTQQLKVERANSICGLIDTLIDCLRRTIEDECDHRAAQWIFDVKTVNLSPVKQFLGCKQSDENENDLVAVAILFSLGLLTLVIIVSSLCVCRFRQLKRHRAAIARLAKQKAENGAFVAAEAVLTNSSDLHCCGGHVTALVRDDHKSRPPAQGEHMMMVLSPGVK